MLKKKIIFNLNNNIKKINISCRKSIFIFFVIISTFCLVLMNVSASITPDSVGIDLLREEC